MNFNLITKGIMASIFCMTPFVSLAQEQAKALEEINVIAETSESKALEIYAKPGAVTQRNIGVNSMESLDSIVRAMPGVYSQMDPGQGGISVNIRGMYGLGRVNTMIDGVPQTHQGISANGGGKYHSGNGPLSQFGALVDSNFLTRVEVTKGHTKGSAGVNSLSGSANFKTIDVEDVLLPERKFGILSKLNYGNNDLGKSAMLALAAKQPIFNSGSLGILLAGSRSQIEQNYRRGDGSYAGDKDYLKNLAMDKQTPKSYLGKLSFKPNEKMNLKFTGWTYQNNLAGRKIDNETYNIEGEIKPDSNWLDLHLFLASSHTKQLFNDGASLWALGKGNSEFFNKLHTFDLHNTNRIELGKKSALEMSYGVNLLVNKYNRHINPLELEDIDGEDKLANFAAGATGKQKIKTLYFDSSLSTGRFILDAGINYAAYQLIGIKPACASDEDIYCFPAGAYQVNKKDKALNYSLGLSAKATDWLQPFVKYSQTSRAPNIQEMFNTNRNGLSVNPFLKPEKSHTYELGFNINKENLLMNNDFFGLKAVYFNSHIDNYIYGQSYYACRQVLCDDINQADRDIQAQIYINALDKAKIRGYEVELSYYTDNFFSHLTYTRSKSAMPVSTGTMLGQGYGLEPYSVLPEDYATAEIGTKLFEQKLILSTILKYTGKAKRVSPEGKDTDTDQIVVEDLPKIPVIVDLYLRYQVNQNMTLKAGIQNVMNKNYLEALNSYNSSDDYDADTETYRFSNSARGRTYTAGIEIRF